MGFIDHGNIVNMIRVSFKLSDFINIMVFFTRRGKKCLFLERFIYYFEL